MIPSPGRIVQVRLSSLDVQRIRARRGPNTQMGNEVNIGDSFPAMIVRVWDEKPSKNSFVNLQVFLDGEDTYWATSRKMGDRNGDWYETPRT